MSTLKEMLGYLDNIFMVLIVFGIIGIVVKFTTVLYDLLKLVYTIIRDSIKLIYLVIKNTYSSIKKICGFGYNVLNKKNLTPAPVNINITDNLPEEDYVVIRNKSFNKTVKSKTWVEVKKEKSNLGVPQTPQSFSKLDKNIKNLSTLKKLYEKVTNSDKKEIILKDINELSHKISEDNVIISSVMSSTIPLCYLYDLILQDGSNKINYRHIVIIGKALYLIKSDDIDTLPLQNVLSDINLGYKIKKVSDVNSILRDSLKKEELTEEAINIATQLSKYGETDESDILEKYDLGAVDFK